MSFIKLTQTEELVKASQLTGKGQLQRKMTEANVLEGLSMHELKQRIQQEQAIIDSRQDENMRLNSEYEAYKQARDTLKIQISVLQKKIKNAILPCISYDTFRLQRKTEQIMEEAEEHKTIRLEMEEMIPRKIEDNENEVKRNQQLLEEVEKSKTDWDMLELVAEMSTKFEDGEGVMRHVHVLDQIKTKYNKRLSAAFEMAQQLREGLKMVENKQNLEASQMGMKMSDLKEEKLQLQVTEETIDTEYDDVLDRKEEYFGPTQIEMAIVNIHDMVTPHSNKNDASDIKSMLEKIQEFITDNYEILEQYKKQYGSLETDK